MTQLTYNGKRIIPAPFINITENFERSGEGEITGTNYSLVLTGNIIAEKGSPDSNKSFWTLSGQPSDENISEDGRLAAILRKQEALQELFSPDNEGSALEIQSADGSQPLKAFPKILSIEFPADLWYQTGDYTITMSADEIFPLQRSFTHNISDAQESWSIDPEQNRETESDLVFRVTHTLSAVGKRVYDSNGDILKQPWRAAKDWAMDKAWFDNNIIFSSGVNDISSGVYNGYDHLKSESLDEQAGQYSLTETWVLSSGTALEDFDISLTKSIDSPIKGVTIQGNIRGLEQRDSNYEVSTTKIDNAVSKFNNTSGLFFSRCQNHLSQFASGILHSIPRQENIGQNKNAGTLNYSFEYDTRPSGLISSALSEVINVSYIDPNDSFASVFALGRSEGPVLQDTGTSEARQKTLNIEFVKEQSLDPNDIAGSFKFPDSLTSGIIDQLDPTNADSATESFKSQPNKNYDPYTGRASLSLSWTYEK